MRRVWAAVVSVWALLALVAVLAWTRPVTPAPQATQAVVVTKGGHRRVVLVPTAHATTQTSPGAASTAPVGGAAQAAVIPVGARQATTQTS